MSNINSYGFPFNSVASDRQYSANDWRDYFSLLGRNGVVIDADNELLVTESSIPAKTVQVDTGAIIINGAMLYADTTTELTFSSNTSGNTRIDRVVARLDYDNRLIELAVLEGTPSVSPVAPSLTQSTSTVWELSLAQVELANGYTTITNAKITDERSDESLCGYTTFKGDYKVDKITTGTNAKTYAYTRTQTSETTATQGSLEIETEPSASSSNLVTSGGVYTAIDNRVDLLPTGEEILCPSLVRNVAGSIYTLLTAGTPAVFESGTANYTSVTKINTDKYLVCYSDGGDSNKGKACVLSVSGTTITAGTPAVFESGATTNIWSVSKLDTDKALVCYTDGGNSNYGTACAMTVSGTTITVGTPAVFASVDTSADLVISAPVDTNKGLVTYVDRSSTGSIKWLVLTVSGTTITANTAYDFGAGSSNYLLYDLRQLDTNKLILSYRNTSSYPSLVVLTVSGTTVSRGTSITSNSSKIAVLSASKIIGNNTFGFCVFTISSSTITQTGQFAPYNYLGSSDTNKYDLVEINANKCIYVSTSDEIYEQGIGIPISISTSNNVTVAAPKAFETGVVDYLKGCAGESNQVMVVYQDEGNSNYGTACILTNNVATGYSLTGSFFSNDISGRSDGIDVVPYISLT